MRTVEREAEKGSGQGKERSCVRMVWEGAEWKASKRCSVSPASRALILCSAQLVLGKGRACPSCSQPRVQPVFTRTGSKRHGSRKVEPQETGHQALWTTQAPEGRHPFWEPRGEQP